MNIRFALPIALPSVLLAATALAGCADKDDPGTAAPPASTATAVVPVSEAASPAAKASGKAPSGGVASGAAAGCPVTAAVLEKAFKANKEIADNILLGKGLKDVSCYGGWATATATPENMDQAVVLFKYDAAKKTWAAVIGGTDGVCRDRVPEAVATHLKGCQN
ncbi:hypothetical protein [Dactylosporangium sp. NPDC051541]|uniref:hypothetical protein n=1 Tax=Dactylosporangium sp. NPDC051541 TaxID=3363977 RepID=UPI003788DF2F